MFKNYLKTAWRNLVRNKTFSLLNVAGLAIGISCTSLIFLWIEYHLTYNHSIPDYNNIYEVENNQTYGSDKVTFPVTSVLVKDALQQEFPGVANVSRYSDADGIVSSGDKRLSLAGAYVDSAFFKMFGLPLVEGNVNDALNNISQIAISQKLAKTCFGNSDALGKTLLVDNNPYKVSAVYKDIPQDVQFYGEDFFLPFEIYYDQNKDHGMNSWGSNWASTWVELNPGTNVISFNMNERHPAPLIYFNNPHHANYIYMKLNPTDDLQGTISKLRNIYRKADVLVPFDYHFIDEDFDRKFHDQQFIGSLATIFGCLAIFISCLGLFGLSAFMAEQRKKEVGLRKVLGASVSSIFTLLSKDFLILVVLSLVIAFPIAYWVMNGWLQNFDYRMGISWYIFVVAALLALLIALAAVSFQAIRAARANPVRSLRME